MKDDAHNRYEQLQKLHEKEARSIVRAIRRSIEHLKVNPQRGESIQKKLIPSGLQKAGISNLYRLELPSYWRIIYTLQTDEHDIFIFILNIPCWMVFLK